ncbi:MAG: formylglycine-generating enzyme family protein, partial [Planctomycetales bacterium]|nr:formylglycine-generating enzyme family protein [Planctomycetales bacterium]
HLESPGLPVRRHVSISDGMEVRRTTLTDPHFRVYSMHHASPLFLIVTLWVVSSVAGGPETRLLPQQPATGRFVETDRGFMVPYQQRIPGSGVVIEMVPVPGGEIRLEPIDPSSGQPKTVSFEPFWIGKFEITMQQYMPYRQLHFTQKRNRPQGIDQAGSPTDVDAVTSPTEVYDPSFNFQYAGHPDSPMPTASQFAARQYTKYLSLLTGQTYRLPLRSEWQHACLAGSQSGYCFQDGEETVGDYAVYIDNVPDESQSLRVGTKKPNAWGLHDVHGNVSEFVIDDNAVTGMEYGHVACGGNCLSDAKDCTAKSFVRTDQDWWDEDPCFPNSPWWMTSELARVTGFRIVSPLNSLSDAQKKAYWDADSAKLTSDVKSSLDSGRGSFGRVLTTEPTTKTVD